MAENKETNQPTIEDLKAPLFAAVGAADLALATVNEIVASLRERAEEARTDANARVEEGRARLTKLQEELPGQVEELREKFSTEELRKAAETFAETANKAKEICPVSRALASVPSITLTASLK